jgi:hypothetical protein
MATSLKPDQPEASRINECYPPIAVGVKKYYQKWLTEAYVLRIRGRLPRYLCCGGGRLMALGELSSSRVDHRVADAVSIPRAA